MSSANPVVSTGNISPKVVKPEAKMFVPRRAIRYGHVAMNMTLLVVTLPFTLVPALVATVLIVRAIIADKVQLAKSVSVRQAVSA